MDVTPTLREVEDADLEYYYVQMKDPEAVRMAGFTAKDPSDRSAFDAHWARIRSNPEVFGRTIVGADGDVLGHVAVYGPPEEREVTYWIGREHWGRGVASAALKALLALVPDRPLQARAAADNIGSIRVLEKCGFVLVRKDRGFANARGAEIDEVVLTLADGH